MIICFRPQFNLEYNNIIFKTGERYSLHLNRRFFINCLVADGTHADWFGHQERAQNTTLVYIYQKQKPNFNVSFDIVLPFPHTPTEKTGFSNQVHTVLFGCVDIQYMSTCVWTKLLSSSFIVYKFPYIYPQLLSCLKQFESKHTFQLYCQPNLLICNHIFICSSTH